jgi:hypothetical protein
MRGGKRQGAGRPLIGTEKLDRRLTIRLSASEYARLAAQGAPGVLARIWIVEALDAVSKRTRGETERA